MNEPPPSSTSYSGSIPAAYDALLVPLLFAPFAADLAARARALEPSTVLETACGTGVVTRELRGTLPAATSIIATDLSEGMLDQARARLGQCAGITWRAADACALPFPDQCVDLVVCQFGLMFFPDRVRGLAEARRVLRPGGHCLMHVWDGFETNPIGRLSHENIVEFFPDDPPGFYRVPFSLSDRTVIRGLFESAGLELLRMETVPADALAPTARDAATGMVTGSPAFSALEERGVRDPEPIIARLAERFERAGGRAPFRVPMQAIHLAARRGAE